jgi:hypothetical protein
LTEWSSFFPNGQRDYYTIKEATVEKYPEAHYLKNAPSLPSDGTRCPREKFKVRRNHIHGSEEFEG